jgi:hypothetical protein
MLKSIRRTLGDSYREFTKERCYVMPDGFTGYRLTRKEGTAPYSSGSHQAPQRPNMVSRLSCCL